MGDGSDEDRRPAASAYAPLGGGRPALATSIAVVVLVLLSLVTGHAESAVYDTDERIGYLIGGVILGFLLWLICWAITIRRASRLWKIASLAILTGSGMFITLAQLARAGVAEQADLAATMARLKAVASSASHVALVPDARDGPLARMTVAAASLMLADNKAFDQALASSGFAMVFTFRGLERESPVLQHCDGIAALTDRAAALARRFPDYLAAARAEGEAAIAGGKASRIAVDRFLADMARQEPGLVRHWRSMGEIATDGAALCELLARRNWYQGPGGKLLFSNGADLLVANNLLTRLENRIDQLKASPEAELN